MFNISLLTGRHASVTAGIVRWVHGKKYGIEKITIPTMSRNKHVPTARNGYKLPYG